MGGMARMSGIKVGTATEPMFYDKDGVVQAKPKVSKPQVTSAKRVSTLTAAEARAAAKARKAAPRGK